ncbi:MAG: efflux RND transporter periplasmic adaptor subunit [Chthoniobacteraceae bacterium]
MNAEKGALDGLRIDRGARAPAPRSPRPLVILVLVLLIVGAISWWAKQPGASPVRTAIAREQTTGGTTTLLNASGYVTARRAATVSSKVTGKVTEVLVEEGMKVEAEQIIARLDASNVEAALRLSEAQLASATTAIDETKANLAFAERELKRFADLAANKVVSDSDLRRAETEVRALAARLARQTADIEVAGREVAQWKQQLDDTIIRAPFAGVVTTKNAQPGEMISPMSVGGFTRTGVCTIVDMGSLEIDVDVNESYINRVQPGRPVQATLDAYPDWRIAAKVIAIIPTADRQKATVKVRVGFIELDPRILPEMGVKVAFQGADAESSRSIVVVPKAAVRDNVAWIVRAGRVERRAVTIAQMQGDEAVITAGINGGERVVLDAPAELTDGQRVSEKQP